MNKTSVRSRNTQFTLRNRARERLEEEATTTTTTAPIIGMVPTNRQHTWQSGQRRTAIFHRTTSITVAPPPPPERMLHLFLLPRNTLPRLRSMDVSWPVVPPCSMAVSMMANLPTLPVPPRPRITHNKAWNWGQCHRGRRPGSHWLGGAYAVEWKA